MNTDQTREALERARVKAESAGLEADIDLSHEANAALADAEEAYRAALALHEATCKAEALRDMARAIGGDHGPRHGVRMQDEVEWAEWLNSRADRIEQEAK